MSDDTTNPRASRPDAPSTERLEETAEPSETNAKAELGNLLDDLDRYGER